MDHLWKRILKNSPNMANISSDMRELRYITPDFLHCQRLCWRHVDLFSPYHELLIVWINDTALVVVVMKGVDPDEASTKGCNVSSREREDGNKAVEAGERDKNIAGCQRVCYSVMKRPGSKNICLLLRPWNWVYMPLFYFFKRTECAKPWSRWNAQSGYTMFH